MTKQFSLPRGTTDILPANISLWQDIEHKANELFRIFGYREIRTPIFEDRELFARSMGSSSEIVQKQMLNLASQNEEKVGKYALRPENTASIVRSYIENRLDQVEPLSKLFYMGPMFRGERPQKGRLRQFHQIGVEAIGPQTRSPYLDAEVIALSLKLLESFGIKKYQLKINTLGAQSDKKRLADYLKDLLQGRRSELSEYSQQRYERNVFRILDSKNKDDRRVVESLELTHEVLSQESQDYFERVKEALNILDIAHDVEFNLVRGLDYYSDTVFEISSSELGSQDALGAGGRYNDLITQLGGQPADAVGFALGLERIILALNQDEREPARVTDYFILVLTSNGWETGVKLLDDLRQNGYNADLNYRDGSVKSQMRVANKMGAKYVLLLGEDELNQGSITIKNMENSEQSVLKLDQVIQHLAG